MNHSLNKIIYSILIVTLSSIKQTQAQCLGLSCNGISPGIFLADPLDCKTHFLCLQGGIISDADYKCADGQYFSEVDNTCMEYTEDFRCQVKCPPVSCVTDCTDDFEVIPISGNCEQYNICVPIEGGWDPTIQNCEGETPYFDSQAKTCIANPTACCYNDFPYCFIPYVQIPDSTDCKKFYVCMAVGVPTMADLFECDNEYFFNATSSTCEEDINSNCQPVIPPVKEL